MSNVKNGDTVLVHYTGTLNDGSQFDSSEGGDPLKFTLGEGTVIPGFEEAIATMSIGDEKTVTIVAEQAYGERDEALLDAVPRDQFPPEIVPEKGLMLQAKTPEGGVVHVTIVDFDDTSITLDGNHPLAGHDLTFALKLVGLAD